MCGIICYIGRKNAVPILLNGLSMVEYRGYDSAGIAIIDNAHNIRVIKQKGCINDFNNRIDINQTQSNIGIAHTRWATHGEPNNINAHPHTDCSGDIAIIHNGIIENYATLKNILIKQGHTFTSDTDSEVLAHLIEQFYGTDKDIKLAVRKALKLVEGTFGLAVIHSKNTQIVLARRGSPLIIGVGDGEIFAASDATPLLPYTRNVVYVQDNELVVLTEDAYSIEDINGIPISRDIERIRWNIQQVEKKGYEHFMLKEIYEQPEAISNTLRGRIKDNIKLSISITNIQDINKIIILGCGTSWHAGLIGKYLIENIAEIPVETDYASEFRYRNPIITGKDLVIVISQSGETADTLAALREAKSRGANTLGIINVVGSTIARDVDSGIYLHAGPEIGVASTKAFSCQVTALLLLAVYIRQHKGLKPDSLLIDSIRKLPEIVQKTLEQSDNIRNIAESLMNSKNFLFLGRGINYPTALEGALKLKEISYIHAEGYPAAEMKHGPIALIDEEMPVLFIATKSSLSDKILSNIQEVKARKGKILVVTNKGNDVLEKLADYLLYVPEVIDELSPLINIIPLQLLAYHIASLKGLNVDKPRNLAKSVTVE